MCPRYSNVTNGQTDGRHTIAIPRGKMHRTSPTLYWRVKRLIACCPPTEQTDNTLDSSDSELVLQITRECGGQCRVGIANGFDEFSHFAPSDAERCHFASVWFCSDHTACSRIFESSTYWLKIAIFSTSSHLASLVGVNPFEFLDELFIAMTRVRGPCTVILLILACVVSTQC